MNEAGQSTCFAPSGSVSTPVDLRANDLRALLKLIDPDTFEREWLFDVCNRSMCRSLPRGKLREIPIYRFPNGSAG